VARLRLLILFPLLALLAGCEAGPLNPAGDVAVQQRNLLIESTVLMLFIIVPVMFLIVFFAWRYRQSNKAAPYEPDWDHSTHLELAIWSAPLLIIVCLGALTWVGTHLLDPYRQIGRIAAGQPVAADARPVNVEVVALDWKWLFIYPDYGIATVNEMAAPVDTPINFKITASSVMNSFYIPALAGQIYAMPGMQTALHAVINQAGDYKGFSANYSGAGFSGMHFVFKGLSQGDFDAWIARARAGGGNLDRQAYLALERPSENVPVATYAAVGPGLYDAILNMCVEPGKMCESQMAAIDAKGGLGLAGIRNTIPVADNRLAPEGTRGTPRIDYVASLCTADDPMGMGMAMNPDPTPKSAAPLTGAGLMPPQLPPRLGWLSPAAPPALAVLASNS
jgi:cytochrome o ubiquinol oxidase subunit 2